MSTLKTIDQLQRDQQNLLRRLGLDLEAALRGYQDPERVRQSTLQKFKVLCRDLDQFVAISPHAKGWAELVKKHTEEEIHRLCDRAKTVHERRNEVQKGLAGKYNDLVSSTLSKAPSDGRRALDGQVDSLMRNAVGKFLTDSQIPGHVKDTVASELAKFLKQQEFVEDAFFAVERVLSDLATWLHRRLTISREISYTRDEVAKLQSISPKEIGEADARVGALAKQAQTMDANIARQMQQSLLRVKGYFNFRPNLVLDPAKGFLDSAELRTGIKITKQDVQVDLGTRVRIDDPFQSNRSLTVNPYVNVNATLAPNLTVGGSYQSTIKPMTGEVGHEFRVQLRWRF